MTDAIDEYAKAVMDWEPTGTRYERVLRAEKTAIQELLNSNLSQELKDCLPKIKEESA